MNALPLAHRKAAAARDVVAVPATDPSGGIAQPIGYVVSSLTTDPGPAAAKAFAALAATPGTLDATTSLSAESPQVEVEFDRGNARALDARSAPRQRRCAPPSAGYRDAVTGPQGLKDVQVIYPEGDLNRSMRSPRFHSREQRQHRPRGRHHEARSAPAPPLIMRINRRNVVLIGANVAPGAILSNVERSFERRLRTLNLPSNVSVTPVTGGNQQNVHDTVTEMASRSRSRSVRLSAHGRAL